MAKKVDPTIETFARIKVVGIGGAGGSAINRMIEAGIGDVEFIAVNTDAQALHHNKADRKVHIGPQTTRGLGAGGDPKVGQDAAQESSEEIKKAIEGADILFLTLGAGGGTGSGAAHVVAQIAREMGILTVAFVTKPFGFEVEKRTHNADYAISNLSKYVDTLVLVPNDNLLKLIDMETTVQEAFKIADDVLRQGVQGIADLITEHGLVNLDFADIRSIMQDAGQALMGIGRASGENRASIAAQQAIDSPLLDVEIDGAKGVLFNIIGGDDLTLHEIDTAASVITDAADEHVNVIFGATINPELQGEIIITVIATGFDDQYVRTRIDDYKVDLNESEQPSSATLDKESNKEKKKYLPKKAYSGKISSHEDLPSLPIKSSKEKNKEVKTDQQEVDYVDDDDDISTEEIIKEVDLDYDETQVDEKKSKKSKNIIDEDDEDEMGNLWDDVDTDESQGVDLNKPTFLRKLSAKRRQRKERKEEKRKKEAQDEDAADDEDL